MIRLLLATGLFFILTTAQAATGSFEGMDHPRSVQELWAGYDPRVLPLDIEVKEEWTEDHIHYRKFYFTGEIWEGVPVRVFAYTGTPVDGKKLPAVLHIHGGGQTARLEWVKFWAKRGYVVGSFDFSGPVFGHKETTQWGKFANKPGETNPSIRHNGWVHWILLSRRMLTVLEQMPETDPERMGIFGISVGGTLTWMVAGSDSRVKVAVPIYGNGWSTYGPSGSPPPANPDEATVLRRATAESEAYAPFITCPVLFMSATQDGHGKMDNGYRTLALTRGIKRVIQTPYYDHHVEPGEGVDLPLWMDAHLRNGEPFPETPQIKLRLTKGVAEAIVTADKPDNVVRVKIFYCLGDKVPEGRFWRLAKSRSRGCDWLASLPTVDTRLPVRAFANVYYRSGMALTSEIQVGVPAQMGAARATLRPSLVLEDFADGFEGWYAEGAYTDPFIHWSYLSACKGKQGRGVTFSAEAPTTHAGKRDYFFGQYLGENLGIDSNKIGDPQFRGPSGASLSFWFKPSGYNMLKVRVEEDTRTGRWHNYVAEVKLDESPAWQRFVLAPDKFKTTEGNPLGSWERVDRISFIPGGVSPEKPILGRIEWMMKRPKD